MCTAFPLRETALNSMASDTKQSNAVSLPLCSCYYGASVLLMQHVRVRGSAVTFTPRLKHLDRIFIFLLSAILNEGRGWGGREKCVENGTGEKSILPSAQVLSFILDTCDIFNKHVYEIQEKCLYISGKAPIRSTTKQKMNTYVIIS